MTAPTQEQVEKAKEKIMHAAVKSKDGWIFIGKCHADCFMKARNINVEMVGTADFQGFVTSKGVFVDRKEAAKIAWLAGQTNKEIKILFSEDLWSEQYDAKHTYCEIEGYKLDEETKNI